MKAVIISLDSHIERFHSSRSKVQSLPIDIERLPATNGCDHNEPLTKRYNEKRFVTRNGRKAEPGEIGCYCSHFRAWQKCVEINEPLLVLEDDITVNVDKFASALTVAVKYINKFKFLRMENYSNRKEFTRNIHSIGEYQLVENLKQPLNTTCYMIHPDVAREFIRKSLYFDYPVDVFIRNKWIHGQKLYGVKQSGLDGCAYPSLIGRRKNYSGGGKAKVTKFLFKNRNLIMNGISNLYL